MLGNDIQLVSPVFPLIRTKLVVSDLPISIESPGANAEVCVLNITVIDDVSDAIGAIRTPNIINLRILQRLQRIIKQLNLDCAILATI